VAREELLEALKAAFRKALGSSLETSILTASERRRAERRLEMYRHAHGPGTAAPAESGPQEPIESADTEM
jgi:hypothetical protein